MKAIYNAHVITDKDLLENHSIIFDESIRAVVKNSEIDSYDCREVFDAKGKYASAGFIDIHMHGCGGNDTMDDNENSIARIAEDITATGVTAFLPTTMTMSFNKIENAIRKIRANMNLSKGAEVLGCNLEGPFISDYYKGAHDGNYILTPDFNMIDKYKDVVKIVTLAPELEGSTDFINACVQNNIIPSIGHTGAEYEQALKAVFQGAAHFTHTFNGMKPLHHRNPGTAGVAMDTDATCELIADNIHVHPSVQRLLIKVKGIGKVILVSDAMRACLLQDGYYELGGNTVAVNGNEARLSDGTLAGSVLTLNVAIKNIIYNTNISIVDAVKMATINPARVLGLEDRKGSIGIGKDADITIFDNELSIDTVFVKGKKVFGSQT